MSAYLPLEGVRVLDLTRLLAGGFVTMVLADLGAEVLKLEQPGVGDGSRTAPPYAINGDGALHVLLGRGKRSVTCALDTEAGREVMLDLVGRHDVLVESFRPGFMERLGLGPGVLAEANPRLVQVAVTGYGSLSGRATDAGHDLGYLAAAGLLSLNGEPERPTLPGTQVADVTGALWAVVAVLAGLRAADATGQGGRYDVALSEAALTAMAIPAAGLAVTGRVPGRGTEWFNGGFAAYDVYRCADGGHVAVAALEPKFFATLCAEVGDESLRPMHGDPERQDELRARLAAIFAGRPRGAWEDVFAATDACVVPVYDLREAMATSWAAVDVPLREAPPSRQAGLPFTAGGSPAGPAPERPAPALGEHTEEVLRGLGYDEERIAELRGSGAV